MHFDKRDGALSQFSIAMKNRVEGIFPALIGQPGFCCAFIFEETVAIYVPVLIDPLAAKVIDRQRLGLELTTDFVVRRLDNEYLLVEIEKPIYGGSFLARVEGKADWQEPKWLRYA